MVEKIKLALERAYLERGENFKPAAKAPTTGKANSGVDDERANILEPGDEKSLLGGAKYCLVDSSRFLEKRIVTADDDNANTEQFRLLRSKLLYMLKMEHVSTIGITSPCQRVGKTLSAVNLAVSLARSGEANVVLVDGDAANPSVHKLLGVEPKYGLADMLTGNVDVREVILRLSMPNLWLIPGREQNLNLLDQATTNRVEQLVDDFSVGSQSIVIVDLPPVLGKDETIVFASNMDAVLMVVGNGVSKTDEVNRACSLLEQCNLIGTILNKSIDKI